MTNASTLIISAGSATASIAPTTTSNVNLAEKPRLPSVADAATTAVAQAEKLKPKFKWGWSWKLGKRGPPSANPNRDLQKRRLPASCARTLLNTLLAEWRLDYDYKRFALMDTSPFLVCVSLNAAYVGAIVSLGALFAVAGLGVWDGIP
ncbi:hypothetical protein DFH07DRAFT_983507 [Mycena maculata]|uniref:Uncharacterized protein n=1 Tax=Mycena maculata TaxID=230809 RepID=A0AAD7IBX0_9AGAR|nr:hypothetical protein DFH07DRAFT_983507 [Mycena maculata]